MKNEQKCKTEMPKLVKLANKLLLALVFFYAPPFLPPLSKQDWRTAALDEPSTVAAAVGALSACNETVEADRIYADAIERSILPDPVEGKTWTTAALQSSTAAGSASATAVAVAAADDDGGADGLKEKGAKVGGRAGARVGVGAASVGRTSASAEAAWWDGDVEVEAGEEAGAGGARADGRGERAQREPGGRERGRGEGMSEGGAGGMGRKVGRAEGGELLWVDLRRTPVTVVPAAVRRVVRAMKAVGSVSDGLVVEWGGARGGAGGEEGSIGAGVGGGGGGGGGGWGGLRKPGHAGRRGTVLEAFGRIEPALQVTEPSDSRGQVRVAAAARGPQDATPI